MPADFYTRGWTPPWHARYTIIDPETGQRVRRSLYGATEQEARAKLIRALDALERGALPLFRGRTPTLAEYGQRWLGQCRVRPRTLHCYEELLRYALPSLGHLQLTKLEPHHIGTLLTRLRDRGLAARTCNHVRAVLRNLLNQAKREGLVPRNVAELARPLPLEDPREGATLWFDPRRPQKRSPGDARQCASRARCWAADTPYLTGRPLQLRRHAETAATAADGQDVGSGSMVPP